MSPSLPPLKESQVRALATEQSFQRGQRYYRDGAISSPVIQGHRLWANCEGSMTYYPWAILGPEGVEASDCTCPYDWGGLCKHQVALLLTYIQDRDRIQVLPPIADMLAQHSREDLVALIERMVQHHPDLMAWVDLTSRVAAGEAPNLDNYRQAAERVFQGDDMDTMATALKSLVAMAADLAQRGQWAQASDIYQLLLEVANDQYDHCVREVDYDGDVAVVVQDMAQGLGDSLGQGLDGGRHCLGIETCFEAVIKDIELGGIDYAYPAREALINHGTDEDWVWIEGQIHQILQGRGRRRLSLWGQESLAKLLAERTT